MEPPCVTGDKAVDEKVDSFRSSVKKVGKMVNTLLYSSIYDNLSTKDKIEYDLFLAYTFNTLYWLYLRTKGVNPQNEDIKNQLNRVKQMMVAVKNEEEINTLRPRIDKGAAARFIKHGLNHHSQEVEDGGPPSKKTKLDE